MGRFFFFHQFSCFCCYISDEILYIVYVHVISVLLQDFVELENKEKCYQVNSVN